ncbi:MAG: nicotinate phosphoribosyltransferase [Erysipelotrichaceae bacterium]
MKLDLYEPRNLSMLMDFYELTMANGYFMKNMLEDEVVFDMYYRKNPDQGGFVIACGLQQVVDYILNMHFSKEDIDYLRSLHTFNEDFLSYLSSFHFTGNLYAVKEGTIVYPNTPLLTIKAHILQAQIVETMILLTINHQSLIATKANRIVRSANGVPIMEFGARRAHGYDAAIYGTRAAYIGGCTSTATTLAAQKFGIKAVGTMAHSWVQYFNNEYDAFKAYAQVYPEQCTLLVDTYNVLKSGIPNAIKVANSILHPLGHRLAGIRIDSGDLAYLSKKARILLDQAGLTDCKIVVSNSVDEYLIQSLNEQGAKIDSYGVGERLITAKSEPVFGGVYKLVATFSSDTYTPKIKVSENIEKVTNPGFKRLYRAYDEHGIGQVDIIAHYDEEISHQTKLIDPAKTWKSYTIQDNWEIKEILLPIIIQGKLVEPLPTLEEIHDYVKQQLTTVWDEEKRFSYPHIHYVDLTENLYKIKVELLHDFAHER